MPLLTLGQTLVAGLASGVFYALLALPFAIVLGLTRALNLAHGELVILGGYIGYAAGRTWGLPLPIVALVAAVALIPLGFVWRAILRRVRDPLEMNSLALTFGLALLLQNATVATWSADYRLIPTAPTASHVAGGLGLSRERAAAALVGLGVFLLLHVLLTRTRWGTAVRATSRDSETAALMGVNTDRVARAAFAVAAALAGAGGALFAALHYLHPAAGVDLTLSAVTLSVLAGVGRIPGLLAAGVAVGLAEALALTWTGPRWRELVVAALLLGTLLVRARGLAGGRGHG